MLCGCDTGDTQQSSPTPNANRLDRITSLSDAILQASEGDVIDLQTEKYRYIDQFGNVSITKSVTIRGVDGKTDFQNAVLNISVDGVDLENVSNAAVNTQGNLKISSSSLTQLNIKSISESNQNIMIGRGAESATMKPYVEVEDTHISSQLDIGLDGSVIVFSGNSNTVSAIKSNRVAVVYWENSDSITLPDVTSDGEVTYINKDATDSVHLIALTPYSGLKTVFRVGDKFDLSGLKMMGTYETAENSTVVYRANEISYRMKSTFTRLEQVTPQYSDQDGVLSADNICQKSGEITVTVEKDSRRFVYDISVIDNSPSDTPTLDELSVKTQPRKTQYLAGEKLDLSGLVVLAKYHSGNVVYQTVVTDYTASLAAGSVLSAGNQSVTISFGGKSVNVDIVVKAAWTVRYIVDMSDDAKNFTKQVADGGFAVELTNVMKSGYSYLAWCTDQECYNNYVFDTPVTDNITLYAKWMENANNFTITYKDKGNQSFSGTFSGTAGTDYPTIHHYGEETSLVSPSKVGWTFGGWFTTPGCDDLSIDKIGAEDYTESFSLYALWIPNVYKITYCDAGGLDLSGDFDGDYPQKHWYGTETTLPTPHGIHGDFLGWHRKADCSDTAITSIGAEDVSSDITLYAKWKNGYCDVDGNFVVNGVLCQKTSLKSISQVEVTCSMSDGAFKSVRSQLEISPYAIGKYEVTQQLYKAVMGNNPSTNTSAVDTEKGEMNAILRPVDSVSWYMAVEFCNELSKLMMKEPFYEISETDVEYNWAADGYRLPSECEWECAARGGVYSVETPWTCIYSGNDTASAVAWYQGKANTTMEVGLLDPNDGIYDMSGNVLEWCNELFHSDLTNIDVFGQPETTANSDRVIRGGSFDRPDVCSKVQWRHHEAPTEHNTEFGFRIAQSL